MYIPMYCSLHIQCVFLFSTIGRVSGNSGATPKKVSPGRNCLEETHGRPTLGRHMWAFWRLQNILVGGLKPCEKY